MFTFRYASLQIYDLYSQHVNVQFGNLSELIAMNLQLGTRISCIVCTTKGLKLTKVGFQDKYLLHDIFEKYELCEPKQTEKRKIMNDYIM